MRFRFLFLYMPMLRVKLRWNLLKLLEGWRRGVKNIKIGALEGSRAQ
jgi:hypothetical protein